MKKNRLFILLTAILLLALLASPASGAEEYKLTFAADGAVADLSCAAGEGVALPWPDDLTPPEGKAFGGWQAAGKTYQPGEIFYPTANTAFSPEWVASVTIYISPKKGSTGNSGTSEASPVPDISTAQSKLKGINSGKGSPYSNIFVILDPLTTSSKGTTVTVPVTVTCAGGSAGETDGEGEALLNIGGTVLCKNAVWFRDISMTDTGTHNLGACGNSLRLSGITTPAGSFSVANILGAGSSKNYPKNVEGTAAVPTSLRIDGGTFNCVYGGGLTVAASDTFAEINGGSVNTLYGGGDSKDITGSVHITVNEGTVGNLYAGGHASAVSGKAVVYINGGSVSSVHNGGADAGKPVRGGTTVGCSGEFVPVSYQAGTGVGVLKAETEYRFGDTLRLSYPVGLSKENQAFYGWTCEGKTYAAGAAFVTGNTYLTFTADWRPPVDIWVDAQNGKDDNPGTEAAPKKTLAGANADLKTAAAGGSVYVNRLHIVGEYKLTAEEKLGLNPCVLLDGTLVLSQGSTLLCEADVRVACAVNGQGVLLAPLSSTAVCVDSADAIIEILQAEDAVTVLRGTVGEVCAADVCVRGGTVSTLFASGDVRLSKGEILRLTNAASLTACGGKLTEVTADKTELFVRTGHQLTLNGAVFADNFIGGGTLSFGAEGTLRIEKLSSGKTTVREVAPASEKTVITCKSGAGEQSFPAPTCGLTAPPRGRRRFW